LAAGSKRSKQGTNSCGFQRCRHSLSGRVSHGNEKAVISERAIEIEISADRCRLFLENLDAERLRLPRFRRHEGNLGLASDRKLPFAVGVFNLPPANSRLCAQPVQDGGDKRSKGQEDFFIKRIKSIATNRVNCLHHSQTLFSVENRNGKQSVRFYAGLKVDLGIVIQIPARIEHVLRLLGSEDPPSDSATRRNSKRSRRQLALGSANQEISALLLRQRDRARLARHDLMGGPQNVINQLFDISDAAQFPSCIDQATVSQCLASIDYTHRPG